MECMPGTVYKVKLALYLHEGTNECLKRANVDIS